MNTARAADTKEEVFMKPALFHDQAAFVLESAAFEGEALGDVPGDAGVAPEPPGVPEDGSEPPGVSEDGSEPPGVTEDGVEPLGVPVDGFEPLGVSEDCPEPVGEVVGEDGEPAEDIGDPLGEFVVGLLFGELVGSLFGELVGSLSGELVGDVGELEGESDEVGVALGEVGDGELEGDVTGDEVVEDEVVLVIVKLGLMFPESPNNATI